MPASPPAVYNREQLTRFTNVSVQGEVAAADSADVALISGSPKHQLVVRRIQLNVYTSAAQSIEFRGDGAGGDPVYNVAASPGVGPRGVDWGELGYALPVGEGLEIGLSGAGNAFTFVAEVYRFPSTTMTPAEIR